MKGHPAISPVYRLGPRAPDPDGENREWRLRRALWHHAGAIVIRPSEVPADLAERAVAWAVDEFGDRRAGG